MTSSQINSDLLTAAAVAQLSQSGWGSLSEQWKACIADIVLGNLPEQFILQVSISICSILAQGRTLGFEYKQNLNQHILTDNSKEKTESTINSPTIKTETVNPLIELPSARSALATLVSSAPQNNTSAPSSTTAMLLSNLVNKSATSPTITTADPKTSLLEQMGLINQIKSEFQPAPITTAASLTNQVLSLLKAAQDNNNGVIFNSNNNQDISLNNSLANLTNSLNGSLNSNTISNTINSFSNGIGNSNFNRMSPKKSKLVQNGFFQNGSNEGSHNEENHSEISLQNTQQNLQNSILNSIQQVTQNNTQNNAQNNSINNNLNNTLNNSLNNTQTNFQANTDSIKSEASNLRLISHLPSLLAENLSNYDKTDSQNLSPNTISNNIIDQINAGSLKSTSNLSNGSLNTTTNSTKTKNISNLKRPLENSKNFDWKNQEKPVAIRNPGESIMYECRWCDHKSRRRNDLEDHERRHMEKMNFGCHLCPYRAKQKFTMKHHMYKVHQTKFDASKMLTFE